MTNPALTAVVARLRAWIDRSPQTDAMEDIDVVLSALEAARNEQTSGGAEGHAAQPAEPTATDDLVTRLHDVLRNWTNFTDDEQSVIRDAIATVERQACEIAVLRLAVKDDAQWAQENERLTRERDEWKRKCGDANEWGLRNTAGWKYKAECAERELARIKPYLAKAQDDRDALRDDECVKLRAWVNDAEQAAGREQRRAERAERELADALAANEIFKKRERENCEREFALEADRDALRECVKAADELRRWHSPIGDAHIKAGRDYDAARAKVKP